MNTALLEKEAIKAAMAGAWEKAVEINQEILKSQPEAIAALNRLGRAFWETGDLKRARETFQKVLKLNQYNPIASKNLERLIGSGKVKKTAAKKSLILAGAFLEEPGKTRTVKLIRLAESKVLSALNNADLVFLTPKKRSIAITGENGTYLGSIPDDLSQRLIPFIKGGNRYQAFIKAVGRHYLEIFIRETFRNRRFRNLPSFSPSQVNYIPFLSPEIIHGGKPETTPIEEE